MVPASVLKDCRNGNLTCFKCWTYLDIRRKRAGIKSADCGVDAGSFDLQRDIQTSSMLAGTKEMAHHPKLTLSSLSSRNRSLILSPSTDLEVRVADTHPSFSSVNQALVPFVNTSKDCCAVVAAMVFSS